MKKVILSLLLVVTMLFASSICCAEQLPSPSLQQEITAAIATDEGNDVGADFAIWLTANTDIANEVLLRIQNFIANDTLANYFGEEILVTASEYLPEGYDVQNLMLAELYTLSEVNYVSEDGSIYATFAFDTEYADDATLLGMVGFIGENFAIRNSADSDETTDEQETQTTVIPADDVQPDIEWIVVPVIAKDGCVTVTLDQEILERLSQDEDATFILMQDKNELEQLQSSTDED